MGLLRECDRDSETMGVRETDGERKREREIERGAHGGPRRNDDRRGVRRGPGPSVVKKGRERREKVEVCCAAVGTDCRVCDSCRLSLVSAALAAPAASRSLARRRFLTALSSRRSARPSASRTSPIHPLTLPPPHLSLFLTLFLAPSSFREEENRQDERTHFPFFHLSGSSLDRLYRPVDFSSSSSSSFREIRRRSSLPVRAHAQRTYVHTRMYTPMHCSREENRAFFRTPDRDSSPISFRSPVIN